MQVKETELRRMSVGIIAENKRLDSPFVEIIPIEALNLMDEELGYEKTTLKTSGIDVEEKPYKVEVDMTVTLKAEWLAETNRMTPPDVRRGEQVWIWRQGDADKYYWTTLGRDDDLRRLETVLYRYSGLPENIDEEVTEDNSYYIEWSTHKKTITIKTSQRNEEFCIYTLQFNPGDGQWTVEDNLGNIVQIDSEHTTIHVRNADMSLIEMNRKQIHVQSEDSISFKTQRVHLEAPDIRFDCNDFEIKAQRTRIHGVLHVDELKSGPTQTGPLSAAEFNYPSPGGASVPDFSNIAPKIKYPFPL